MTDKLTRTLANVVMAGFFALLLTWMPYWLPTAAAADIPEIDFTSDFQESVSGDLVPGGRFKVEYDSERLTCARGGEEGLIGWNILGYVKFSENDKPSNKSLETPGKDRILTQEYDIPSDAKEVIMWFLNNGDENPEGCYDSQYGANYHFALN